MQQLCCILVHYWFSGGEIKLGTVVNSVAEANIRIWMSSEAIESREADDCICQSHQSGAENARIGFSKSGRHEMIRQVVCTWCTT